jgi:hypothetical protein
MPPVFTEVTDDPFRASTLADARCRNRIGLKLAAGFPQSGNVIDVDSKAHSALSFFALECTKNSERLQPTYSGSSNKFVAFDLHNVDLITL